MAGNEEILKYTIDKAGAEQSLGELAEKQKQVTAGSAKEADSLDKLTTAERKGADATGELVRQKDKLGSVVNTLGGRFGGLLGNLGNVVELFLSGSKAVVGFGAALAGLTAGIAIIQKIRAELAALVKEQEEAVDQLEKTKAAAEGAQDSMLETLRRFAAATPRNEDAVGEMRRQIERQGFTRGQATSLAPFAVLEGLTPGQAALAAQLDVMGFNFEKPGDIGATIDFLRENRPDVLKVAEEQVASFQQTQVGMGRIAKAEAQPHGAVAVPPVERTRRALIESGVIPKSTTAGTFGTMAKAAQRNKERLDKLLEIQRGIEEGKKRGEVFMDDVMLAAQITAAEDAFDGVQNAIVLRLQRERARGTTAPPVRSVPVDDIPPLLPPQVARRPGGSKCRRSVQRIAEQKVRGANDHG